MAQTTGAFSGANFKVEVSVNGSDWTDISGQATSVTPGGGDQLIGEQHTADGDAPVVTNSNKTEASELEINILYTETASEAFDIVGDRYRGATKTIYVRYAPKGGATANKRFFTANGAGTATAAAIVNCLPPEVDAGSGDPAMATFTVRFPKLVEEAIP
jgi:hypothetical protein